MKKIIKIKVIFIFLLMSTSICQSQNTLDLNTLSINDSLIKDLNIEKVTDMFGRPSATNNNPIAPELVDIMGAQIYYHDKGLVFHFNPTFEDSLKRIRSFEVYLIKRWDKANKKFFLPYEGDINPTISKNMKSKNLISLFQNYSINIRSADELQKEYEENLKKLGMKSNTNILHDRIIVKTNNCRIQFNCEELTKFLEFFRLIYD